MTRDEIADQLASRTFLTFAGTETYLLFLQGYALREFCAFEVLRDDDAWERTERELLRPIANAAAAAGMGVLADTLVWRASSDYVARLGHGDLGVDGVNSLAVQRLRHFAAGSPAPVLVAGDIGPRGDGYSVAGGLPTAGEAETYHAPQMEALAAAGVDLIVALTMTSASEAIGLVRAAERADLPVLVSPTVETDGKLPDGTPLGQFVAAVDDATGGYAVGHMVNCVHPVHIEPVLRRAAQAGEAWLERFRGVRANASTKSHAELDAATELDRGDLADLARRMGELRSAHRLTIVGGCCGTDAEHLRGIASACA
jgi:homocysteine S-methyltransferase